VIQVPGDEVGMAWLQNGDAWAQIFNPATGAVERADLGPSASSDIGTVHILATASGGVAVSWHTASGVEAEVISVSGQVSNPVSLPGDLLGVDANGHAVTLQDVHGTPVLQAYALTDGLFWTG
jgi:hypothetical protein